MSWFEANLGRELVRSPEIKALGLIVSCIQRTKGVECGKHEFTCNERLRVFRGLKVIGSSEQVHVVDALAITGEEGRGSLR